MKVLSLFSGVGGFDLGLENAGMETVFQCEWDKHATKILERHWPDVPRWTDVSTLTGAHVLQHAPVIDVVAWGSPCQDLSVAGKRAGLSGERSGLFHEGIRIIKEIRELTNGKYPRISVWENVAGALSSGAGADFGQVLYEMDEAGACFSEWRMLDAQYFGVPQRRRRVFVVSVFDTATAERCPNPLLPVIEGVRWNPATGRTTRETVAGTVEQSSASSGHRMRGFGDYTDDDTASAIKARDWKDATDLITQPFTVTGFAKYEPGIGTLRSYGGDLAGGSETLLVEPFVKAKRAQSATDDETWVEGDINPTINQFDQGDVRATTVVVGSLQARDHKGTNHEGARDGKLVVESTTAIVMRQREGKPGGGKGPLLSEDKSLTLAANCNDQTLFVEEPMLLDGRRVDDVRVYEPPVQTLQARMGTGGNNVPMLAFDTQFGSNANVFEDQSPTLKATQTSPSVAYPIQDGREIEKHQNGFGVGGEDSPAYTLDHTGAQSVAYSIREDAKANTFSATEMDRANALNSLRPSPQSHHAQMFIVQGQETNEVVGTLRSGGDGGVPSSRGEHLVTEPTMAVRRLTPLECERLMGWPDDWTAGQSDTHRYKQCGNGVASPVAQWIGEQIINL